MPFFMQVEGEKGMRRILSIQSDSDHWTLIRESVHLNHNHEMETTKFRSFSTFFDMLSPDLQSLIDVAYTNSGSGMATFTKIH